MLDLKVALGLYLLDLGEQQVEAIELAADPRLLIMRLVLSSGVLAPASGILVQPSQAATVCELDQARISEPRYIIRPSPGFCSQSEDCPSLPMHVSSPTMRATKRAAGRSSMPRWTLAGGRSTCSSTMHE
ncbi:hypothetical protein [Mesorhizobium sp.]|uniref:hypothetical protein n=1 Tax=Mesorhizobium sp. TaxID=1871066 RepID=UPI0025E820B6|nr:hypothetical protein [Mesorhizobium sp.]